MVPHVPAISNDAANTNQGERERGRTKKFEQRKIVLVLIGEKVVIDFLEAQLWQ